LFFALLLYLIIEQFALLRRKSPSEAAEQAVTQQDTRLKMTWVVAPQPETPVYSDEQQLLRLAQNGDMRAFEELYALLSPHLLRFIRCIVGYGQEADDVLQDTFVALFVNLPEIQAEKLRPYAFRIARNRCYDLLRREGRTNILALDAEPENGGTALELADVRATAPDDAVHWLLLHMEVQDALDRLPPSQRQTLTLYTEAELTYQEIAEVLDVSIGTVKSRLFHAKKNLRGLLRPQTLLAIYDELGNEG
jgi:RNA polymerase sigma-70 factor (ECF subfamily)